jgi:hypothetical protein
MLIIFCIYSVKLCSVRLTSCWWLVLVCSETKILLAGCGWLVFSERKVLLPGGLISQTNRAFVSQEAKTAVILGQRE